MWLMDDDVVMREALGRASFIENVQVVPTAVPLEPSSAPNAYFNAFLELTPDSDSEWDTFFKSR